MAGTFPINAVTMSPTRIVKKINSAVPLLPPNSGSSSCCTVAAMPSSGSLMMLPMGRLRIIR